jgi:predicted ATPase/class 3 adenylate cyclase
MDVGDWLRTLGLEQYEPTFRHNEIDGELLPSLTVEDLKDLGVTLVGHRRRLLEAAAALRDAGNGRIRPQDVADIPARGNGSRRAEAERRQQMTVMFCDLVGSTAMAARLDPEDLRDVIDTFHRCAVEIVTRFDGFVAKYMGDGVLVCFGYPRAHEDDPEQAVRAALAIIDAVRRLQIAERLQVRIGIGTGLVVVYDVVAAGDAQGRSIVGETPNLAARLQALAEPDTVVIGPDTRRLLGDQFEYRDLGGVRVKGLAEPVRAYQVLRPSAVESRFEAMHGERLEPVIGRHEEIELLLRRWQQAKAGEGKVVLLSGEPGIGKSRIAAVIKERIETEPHACLRYFCSSHHQDSALYPVIVQIERAAGMAREDTAAVKLRKLETLLARSSLAEEHVAQLAALLSLPTNGHRLPPETSPPARKKRTLAALLALLEAFAASQPLLMIFEDVHWIDPTSLELLALVVERAQHLPLLLIITARPQFTPPWAGCPHAMTLSLTRLDRREAAALAVRVTGGKALPDEVLEQVLERADGVPLFVEELTKAVTETGWLQEREDRYVLTRPLQAFAIPTTLHASLVARLDRLAPVRELAQIAAAIGREFTDDLIRAVTQWPESEVDAALSALVAAQLVTREGAGWPATYVFKHALVQDAAYDTLLRDRRQALHARIAEILETRFPETVEGQPELLAQHLARAGSAQRASGLWLEAARRMMARGAVAEAVRQLQKGVGLLSALPDTLERQRQELDLQIALGAALIGTRSYTAPETGRAFDRARELCELVGETSQLLPVVWSQFFRRFVGSDQNSARLMAEELLQLSARMGDAGGREMGHAGRGCALLHLGELASARAEFTQALEIDAAGEKGRTFLYGQSGRGLALAYLSLDLMLLGYPDAARRSTERSLQEAGELGHPITLCFAHSIATRVQLLGRNTNALAEHASMVTRSANEYGFELWLALADIYSGWSRVDAGREDEGIDFMRRGVARYRGLGARLATPLYLVTLAAALARAGDGGEALEVLTEASRASDAGNERWIDAEIHRVTGDILLASPRPDAARAETEFCAAIAVAQRQGAKLLEIRSATSLARLWREQGKSNNARALLAPIYGWFTEGFDTPDVREAGALLEALS